MSGKTGSALGNSRVYRGATGKVGFILMLAGGLAFSASASAQKLERLAPRGRSDSGSGGGSGMSGGGGSSSRLAPPSSASQGGGGGAPPSRPAYQPPPQPAPAPAPPRVSAPAPASSRPSGDSTSGRSSGYSRSYSPLAPSSRPVAPPSDSRPSSSSSRSRDDFRSRSNAPSYNQPSPSSPSMNSPRSDDASGRSSAPPAFQGRSPIFSGDSGRSSRDSERGSDRSPRGSDRSPRESDRSSREMDRSSREMDRSSRESDRSSREMDRSSRSSRGSDAGPIVPIPPAPSSTRSDPFAPSSTRSTRPQSGSSASPERERLESTRPSNTGRTRGSRDDSGSSADDALGNSGRDSGRGSGGSGYIGPDPNLRGRGADNPAVSRRPETGASSRSERGTTLPENSRGRDADPNAPRAVNPADRASDRALERASDRSALVNPRNPITRGGDVSDPNASGRNEAGSSAERSRRAGSPRGAGDPIIGGPSLERRPEGSGLSADGSSRSERMRRSLESMDPSRGRGADNAAAPGSITPETRSARPSGLRPRGEIAAPRGDQPGAGLKPTDVGSAARDRRAPTDRLAPTDRGTEATAARAATRPSTRTASRPGSGQDSAMMDRATREAGRAPLATGPLPTTHLVERTSNLRAGSSRGGWTANGGSSLPIRSASDLVNRKDRGRNDWNGGDKHGYGGGSDGWSGGGYSDPWSRRSHWGDSDWDDDYHHGHHDHHHGNYPLYPCGYGGYGGSGYAGYGGGYGYPGYGGYGYPAVGGLSLSFASFGRGSFFGISIGTGWGAAPYYPAPYYPAAYYPAPYYPAYNSYYDPYYRSDYNPYYNPYYNPRPNVTVINNYYGNSYDPYYGSSYYDSYGYGRSSSYTRTESYSSYGYGGGYGSTSTSTTYYGDSGYGYDPGYSTASYYNDYDGYSFTKYVKTQYPYAYRRSYYDGGATTVVARRVYADGPRSYTRYRPERFYFFTDLGDYAERDIPDYVERRQRSYSEDPIDVKSAGDPLSRAYALFAAKDYYASVVAFDDAIRQSKDDGVLYFARAQAFFAIGDYHSAYDDIVRGMDLIPDWGRIQINMYEFYDDKGEFDRQLAKLKDWVADRPNDAKAQVALGYVNYFLQDYASAKECLVHALAKDRDNPAAKRFLDDVIRREADEESQEKVTQNPDAGQAFGAAGPTAASSSTGSGPFA